MRFIKHVIIVIVLSSNASWSQADFLFQSGQKIVLFGDSITFDGTHGQIMQMLVEEQLQDGSPHFYARGSHGCTAARALTRVESELVPIHPDWVLVNFGTNDVGKYSRQEFIDTYSKLVDLIQEKTNAKVVIISPIYQDREGNFDKIEGLVEGLKDLAAKRNLIYAPAFENFRRIRPSIPKNVRYAPDGTHPNLIGHWIFAETILQACDFKFAHQSRKIEIPYARTTINHLSELVGTEFKLDLPDPVEIRITPSNIKEIEVSKTLHPILVDGKLDDWEKSNPLILNGTHQRVVGVIVKGDQDPSARAWFTYDNDAFYFAIEVKDDIIRNSEGSKSIYRDCVELFLDCRSAEVKAKEKSTQYVKGKFRGVAQYLLVPAGDKGPTATSEVAAGDPTMIEGTHLGFQRLKDGYTLEFSIPKERFPNNRIDLEEKPTIDFSINDLDDSDIFLTVTQLRWSSSGSSSFSVEEWSPLKCELNH
jgi:lysophospholipase L1-like esterase